MYWPGVTDDIKESVSACKPCLMFATKQHARMCMYWPGVTDDIKESVSACKPCLMFATKQQREPYAVDAQVKPWTLTSLGNFDFQGAHFIMVLDVAT